MTKTPHLTETDPQGRVDPSLVPDQPAETEIGWFRRNMFKLSGAAFLGGTALTLATNPLGGLEKDIIEAAPWALTGIAVSEVAWIGGAAMMATSAGKKIRNPFKLRGRWDEISQSVSESVTFKAGLAINTVGALGTAGVVAVGAVTALPVETWPGALGIASADIAATLAVRSGLYASIKAAENKKERIKTPKVTIRRANLDDIDRLANLDLLLFDKAYGTDKPQKEEIVHNFTQRLINNPGWMFVSEINGTVEGFVTAFRTDVPIEDFNSWEQSTADGTLEGKVKPDGKYVYVANMTIKHEAVEAGAEDMLLARLFVNAIKAGCEYGYFVSRMPHFKRWVESQAISCDNLGVLQEQAETYVGLRRKDGRRQDPQLRMYESYGFHLQRMVADAYQDEASLNYGVVFRATIPPSESLKKIKPLRFLIGGILKLVAKKPKLLEKVIKL